MSRKTLFIGSFPKETKGGSSTASILLLNTKEFNSKNILKLDSTLDDISRNRFSSRVLRAIKRFVKLTAILLKEKPKSALIFCGHGWGFVEKGIMVFYLSWFGVETVLAPNSGLILQSLEKKSFRRFVRRVFNKSRYIVCQGQYWKDTFSSYVNDSEKLQIVKNWLGEETIQNPLPPFAFAPRNQIKLVYLGWLEDYKGISDLIKASAICVEKGIDIQLDIWGEGSNKSQLFEEIQHLNLSERIHLKGWANEEDKARIYQNQPILVLPSYFEGMPNVVLEAMANGLPVIATDISTLPEIIKDGENGLLVEMKNPTALAERIQTLGLDPLFQQRLRDKAKKSLGIHESARAAAHLAQLLGMTYDEEQSRATILILSDWFEPAYKGGGPITSCYNFCLHFSKDFNIKVITSNRDFKTDKTLPVPRNEWVTKDYGSDVFYASGYRSYFKELRKIHKSGINIVYLQGIFSLQFGIIPLVLAKLRLIKSRFIVAPRGMLQDGAIGQKKAKKELYLRFARIFGLFKRIHFQATDETEKVDVTTHTLVSQDQISVLPNFPNVSNQNEVERPLKKESGSVKLVYYSRVAPKKNLDFYMDVLLQPFEGKVELGIIGPVEDEVYWYKIKKKIDTLPDNVEVTYYGAMPLKESLAKIKEFHFMVLPTLGENYGHVIVESFSVGVPVIISNNTPWLELQSKQLGWDIELSTENFTENLKEVIHLNQEEYQGMRKATIKYVDEEIRPEISDLKNQYESVLNKIIV